MTASFNPSAFSCVILGDQSLTIACADMVRAGGHSVAAMVSEDREVIAWAESNAVPVFAKPSDLLSAGLAPFDWLLSIANLRIISDAVLALPAKGAINFHDGPLPRYAGLNTPAWAIINREAQHGVSWHMLEGGVDEGDLLAQVMVDIADDETAFSLNSKCYAAGMESFASVLSQLEKNELHRTRQDLSQRSYFARDDRPAQFGLIDFAQGSEGIHAQLRGLDFGGYANPLGFAKIGLGGRVFAARSGALAEGQGAPGTVLGASGDSLTVATADGAVALSGVSALTGGALPVKGDVLDVRDDSLDALQSDMVKEEPHWMRALRRMEPLHLPMLGETASGTVATRTVGLPAGLNHAQAVQAVAAMTLQSCGRASGDIAVDMPEANPLTLGWAPLRCEGDIAAQLEKITASKGLAADLPLRDPEISQARPHVLIGEAGGLNAPLRITLEAERATLHADSGLISDAILDLLAERLGDLVARVSKGEDLTALSDIEAVRVTETWNQTATDYDRSVTIHAAFEAQVARTPNTTAVVFEDQTLTYGELNAKANSLAHVLQGKGVTPGTPVGLAAQRNLDLLIGALGILKAGGAYVPMDPAYPADRIAHYISDSGAPVIVTQTNLADSLPKGDAETVLLDGAIPANDTNPESGAGPEDLAYLIYTSGSTGTPKGVMVGHCNVANFFAGMDDRIERRDGDAWLAVTSLSFDISVLELFWTLSRGVKLVLAGDDSRTELSRGPIAVSDKKIDFNLFYWGNDDGVGPKKYELLLKGAKFADANGFNAVWTPERHFHAFGGPYPNPSVTGAAVAAVTKNLSVRAGSCVAPLHHPARIAEEWAVIDNMTGGRVGLAIASGWQPDDFVLRPENTPPANKPAMFAAIDQLRQLWRGEPVEFPKQDGTPFAVVTQPRPVSKELPVWVTTAGNPETWKEAGAIGANVLTHLLGQSVDEVADKIKLYHQALRDAGHDPENFKVTVMLHTYLAATREEAEEIAREPMKDYLRSAAGLIKQYAWAFPAFKRPEGATNPFQVDLESLDDSEMEAILEFAFERYFNDSGLFGTVEDGLARTEELKRIGVSEVACLIDYGIEPGVVLEGLKPLAEVLRRANAGAALADDDFSLAAQLMRHKVSHLQCTPSMAQMLLMNDETRHALSGLRELMVGGEALPGSLADALQKASPARLQNMYGPTETTIWSTTHYVNGAGQTASVGTPITNTQAFILDDKLFPQAIGVAGELYLAGDGVTRGYWNRAELTAERFVDCPFSDGKMYRTGDLAAWAADGTITFMGRADDQVKIRGHRIELGEIEAALADQPGVTQAVVVARDAPGGAQLVGYVTASGSVNEDTLRIALSGRLPDIMVPARIVSIDRMPLTPNKKIDRKALPAPTAKVAEAAVKAAPVEDDTQRAIAAVWTNILGVSGIKPSDNFFALGGHSLLAVQAHRDIKAALGATKLSITDIFRFPTLEGLAAHLGGAGEKSMADTDVANVNEPARRETMSKRRAMRAGRNRAGA